MAINFEQFKKREILLFLINMVFLVAPGIAGLYFFNQSLFIETDWLKLVLLAIAFVAPFATLNVFIFTSFFEGTRRGGTDDFIFGLTSSTMVTGLMIYATIFLAYLYDWNFDNSIKKILTFEVLLLIFFILKLLFEFVNKILSKIKIFLLSQWVFLKNRIDKIKQKIWH